MCRRSAPKGGDSMTDAEMLERVKIGLFGASEGTWRDDMLTVYINEVKAFMLDAGVPEEVAMNEASVGCYLMGVNDLWNYQPGGTKLSKYFEQRVIQLAAKSGGDAS